jgi:hypothetical protein
MCAKILTKLRSGLCGPVMAGAWALAVAGMVGCRPEVEQTPPPMPPAELVRQDNSPRLRELDFAPFERALAGLKKERVSQIREWVLDGTVPDIQRAMAEGKLSAEELTLFFLNRIQRYDGALRSFIELNPLCLQEARAADRQRAAGQGGGGDASAGGGGPAPNGPGPGPGAGRCNHGAGQTVLAGRTAAVVIGDAPGAGTKRRIIIAMELHDFLDYVGEEENGNS